MSFENGLVQIQDPTTTSRVLNITQVGSVNAANVILRNSAGAIVDTVPISGSVTQGTSPWVVRSEDIWSDSFLNHPFVAGFVDIGGFVAPFSDDTGAGYPRVNATVSGTVTVNTELPAAVASSDAFTPSNTAPVWSLGMSWSGATWFRNPGDATNGQKVNITNTTLAVTQSGTWNIGTLSTITNVVHIDDNSGSLTVDNNGTFAVQAAQSGTWNIATVTTVTSITNAVTVSQATASSLNAQVVGNAADAASEAGNPVGIGLTARQTNRTAVSDGQRIRAIADDIGRQVIVLGQVRDLMADEHTTITSTTTATAVTTAISGVFVDITAITFTNTSATATEIQLLNTDGTTVRWSAWVPANDIRGIVFNRPLTGSATNSVWKVKTVTSVASVKVSVQYEKNV